MEELEIKHEFDINEHLHCPACLSIGRKLTSLGKYSEIYQKLTSCVDSFSTQPPDQIQVCWECKAFLLKAVKFVQRVERVNEALKMGQVYLFGTLSSLTTIVLSDTHPNTIYIDDQTNLQTKIAKSEPFIDNDSQEVFDENFEIDTLDRDELSQEKEEIDVNFKIELKTDEQQTNPIIKSEKTINRWARKKALQNKKPKFNILTNGDAKILFRTVKISAIELKDYLESRKCDETMKLKYRCGTCVKEFQKESSLLKHNKNFHKQDKGPFSCDICSSSFKDKRHLAAHVSQHYDKYVCRVCAHCTYSAKERDAHAKQHGKVFQCLKCQLMFGGRREFYRHFKEWHERFVCDYCGKTFKMRYCIKNHIRKQHSAFECAPCKKRFARYNGLWLHNKVHHNTSPSPTGGYCVECDKHYPDVYRYRWHLANSARHKPRKKARIPCPGCEKVFTKNIYMKDHYNLVHLKQFKYRCEQCNKNFIRNADLVKHTRRVHEGILPPKNKICYLCGRGFTTNKILSNHVRTHTGERPCACALCPATFTQRAALHAHTRTHTRLTNHH